MNGRAGGACCGADGQPAGSCVYCGIALTVLVCAAAKGLAWPLLPGMAWGIPPTYGFCDGMVANGCGCWPGVN